MTKINNILEQIHSIPPDSIVIIYQEGGDQYGEIPVDNLIELAAAYRKLTACAEHYGNEDFWYCDTQHIHSLDDPECCADSYNQRGNGYDIARNALREIEDAKR